MSHAMQWLSAKVRWARRIANLASGALGRSVAPAATAHKSAPEKSLATVPMEAFPAMAPLQRPRGATRDLPSKGHPLAASAGLQSIAFSGQQRIGHRARQLVALATRRDALKWQCSQPLVARAVPIHWRRRVNAKLCKSVSSKKGTACSLTGRHGLSATPSPRSASDGGKSSTRRLVLARPVKASCLKRRNVPGNARTRPTPVPGPAGNLGPPARRAVALEGGGIVAAACP
mmetsp:Transcript_89408/g.142336  ORF Transcript_89408/g.142336 Transcript_89408/m.142336 type:complete len:231 (-) Transcript_89408:396-1088(-)